MISDEERREVVRKLRGARYGSHRWERALYDAIDVDTEVAGFDMLGRLAEFIEPQSTIPTNPGEAALASVKGFVREMRHSTKEEQNEYGAMLKKMSVELHPVDRDALLSLADEIDANVDRLLGDSFLLVGALGLMRCYANDIRKALGGT